MISARTRRLESRESAGTRRLTSALPVLVLACCVLFSAVSSASAGVGGSVAPEFPGAVTAGQTNVPGSLVITNGSTPPENVGSVTLTSISLVPSCAGQLGVSCGPGQRDPGVFALGAVGSGRAGTACAGEAFAISQLDAAEPRWGFATVDGTPVALGSPGSANGTCIIDFSFSVLKVPTIDVRPADPGVQTHQLGRVELLHSSGLRASVGGTDFTTVNQAAPAITTTASPNTTLGAGTLTDTATLSGGASPTQTITFTLFGPNNATCAGAPVFTSSRPVTANGNYTSAPFTPTAPGTYRWIASYSGDPNNAPVAGRCNDANENVDVDRARATITTQASAAVALGGQISDTAMLNSGFNPTGTITFRAFGPNNATCAGAPAFTSAPRPVAGNGTYHSGPFTPTQAGSYRWTANYSGDANNEDVTTECNEPNESVLVSALPGPALVSALPGPALKPGACANPKRGTGARDTLLGTPAGDALDGLGASDLLSGLAGDDCLHGGAGADRLTGGPGSDRLFGGSGRDRLGGDAGEDRLSGGSGRDRISAGSGNDSVNPGTGSDRIATGAGNDRVSARGGQRDKVDCGPGRRDVAIVDRRDRTRRCERIRRG